MTPDMLQLGVAGAVAVFAIVQIVKFAKWVIDRRDRTDKPFRRRTDDSRIGQILERVQAIETMLSERKASEERSFGHLDEHITKLDVRMDGFDVRLRDVETNVAAIKAGQEKRP